MKKKLTVLSVICAIVMIWASINVQGAWKTTSAGKMYTTSGSPGYYVGWHRIDGSTYYFTSKGIMVTGWKKISGHGYYFASSGKMLTGWQKIDGKVYYLGSNGQRRIGWRVIKTGNETATYYFNGTGVMQTGLTTIKKKKYIFNSAGALQRGFIRKGTTVYYGDPKTGELALDQWIGNYYFKADGEMAVNCWIESKWVGPDGKFTGQTRQVGWITNNGIRCYYDQNSKLVTGWLTLSGKRYYLNTATGALQYGWFTVGGSQYYANAEGVVQCNAWVGKKFTGDSGAMITGWKTISGKRYYFDPATGDYSVGWKKIKDKYFYFNTSGVKQVSKWIDGTYYVTKTGQRAIGVKKIDSNYYYFSYSMEGKLLKGWVRYSGSLYYAHPEKGYLLRNKWFKMNGKQYYAGSDCKLAQGLVTIGGKKYYFNAETGYMYKKTRIRIKNNIYYFGSDGSQVKNKWVKIQDKYYYFEADGAMAVNKKVGSYYVGPDGARSAQDVTKSIKTVNGKIYCIDSLDVKHTGWQTVGGTKYYFDEKDSAALIGLQTIDGKQYYFQSTGALLVGKTMGFGNKEYTADANGVITNIKTIDVSGNSKGSQIAQFAVNYVGNPYVWGGTSLTKGADCSGFVLSVLSNFGIKVPRVADDQMKGAQAGYKAVEVSVSDMLPGDLVFYGSANYASHVAIYIGNGNIVHASNSQPYPQGGIKISPYNYNTPIRIVRYWS